MTTEIATRRLIEVLADVNRTPGLDIGVQESPLAAMVLGVRFLAQTLSELGEPEQVAMARIHAAVADLAEAVDTEQKEASHGGC